VQQRYDASPYSKYWGKNDLIINFQQTTIAGAVLLASSVIVVVIVLIMTATTGHNYYKGHYHAYCNWYLPAARLPPEDRPLPPLQHCC